MKALSDYIVTSSNAEKIVSHIPADKTVLFAPDKNLGGFINKKLGRNMVLWPGTCIVHDTFSERKIVGLKARHPGALVLAHPECDDVILAHGRLRRLDDGHPQLRDEERARRRSSSRPSPASCIK